MGHIVGVDIGGTFTDGILVEDGTAAIETSKVSTTPPEFHRGFVAVLRRLAEGRGVDLATLLAESEAIYHGCTVGTNALVEGRTAEVALLATRGFRDSILTMRAGRRLQVSTPSEIAHVGAHMKPDPLVPRRRILEIDERIDSEGEAVVNLNEEKATTAIRGLLEEGVRSFAIALLWSVANDKHERRLVELIEAEADDDVFISTSAAVASRTGEYERTVGAVINSLVGPVMVSYLNDLRDELRVNGFDGDLNIMSCAGGVMDVADAVEFPIFTIGSGPAAGVVASVSLTQSAGLESGEAGNLITMDIGGTTTDVALIQRGLPETSATSWHGQFEYFVPTLSVKSVGAGGGSILSFDDNTGTITVGPRSAGADPGPVAYGRGGTEPTVTDANLVLGRLNPGRFLGGTMNLDRDAAAAALAGIGEPLGFGPVETAAAAIRIMDDQMADALRLASVEAGIDPRGFAVAAYGGGGPLHASAVARRLGIGRVVVPLGDLAASWSAFGVANSEGLVIKETAKLMHDPFDPDELNAIWRRLEAEGVDHLSSDRVDGEMIECTRIVEMRYRMQTNSIPVPAPGGEWTEAELKALIDEFELEYERIYGQGTGYAKAGYSITVARVVARVPRSDIASPSSQSAPVTPESAVPHETRTVHRYAAGGVLAEEVSVYDGEAWAGGSTATGPAIVEFPDTTLVLGAGDVVEVDRFGNLIVDVGDGDGDAADGRSGVGVTING